MAAHHCITYPCPLCYPAQPVFPFGHGYTLPMAPIFNAQGCVCPPTSEKTCESPSCPRKNHLSVGTLKGST